MLCLALQRSSGSCGTQVDADAGGSVNDTQGDVGVGPLSTGEPVDEAPENDRMRTMKTVRDGPFGTQARRPGAIAARRKIRRAAAMLPSKFDQAPPSSAPVKAAGGGRRMVRLDSAVDCAQCVAVLLPRRAPAAPRACRAARPVAVGASPWVSYTFKRVVCSSHSPPSSLLLLSSWVDACGHAGGQCSGLGR
jgi:hypothetical protein